MATSIDSLPNELNTISKVTLEINEKPSKIVQHNRKYSRNNNNQQKI